MAHSATKVAVESPERQIGSFIEKFEPSMQKLIRSTRAALRKRVPTAYELIYDNYNFLVFGFSPTERASSCMFSLAANSKGVSLMLLYGASLPDPQKLLQGSGSLNRFVRLAGAETLREPAVEALIRAAIVQADVPLPSSGKGTTIVKSISKKQRPRK